MTNFKASEFHREDSDFPSEVELTKIAVCSVDDLRLSGFDPSEVNTAVPTTITVIMVVWGLVSKSLLGGLSQLISGHAKTRPNDSPEKTSA